MNKKKVLIIVLSVVLIAICVTVAVILIKRDKSSDGTSNEINMEEVSNNITSNSIFGEMATVDVTMELVDSYFGINSTNVEAVVGKIPSMNVHASMYVILKAKDGKTADVKAELEAYAKNYEDMWATYLPEQYDIVKKRRLGNKGNYVYLIVAENAEDLEALIK